MKYLFQSRIRRFLWGLLGVALIVSGLSACGLHCGHSWGASLSQAQWLQQRDKLVQRAASKLDLSAEQKQLLGTFSDKLAAQRQAMLGAHADPRAELQSLIAGPKFDSAKAQALLTEQTQLLQARSPETLAALAAFYDSLNPAQQQQLRALMDRHQGWFSHG